MGSEIEQFLLIIYYCALQAVQVAHRHHFMALFFFFQQITPSSSAFTENEEANYATAV